MPTISVVIPIYNVAKYIANSVLSICKQTLQAYEIILVDDGSSDNSIEVAVDILQRNNFLNYKIIHQENRGVSSARNIGIAVANGEWVICVDSDDYIHPSTFEIASKFMSRDIDVIAFNFKRVSIIPSKFDDIKKVSSNTYSHEELFQLFLLRNIKLIVPAMLIRKNFIEKNNLIYNDSVYYSEDQLYIWNMIAALDSIYYINNILYFYLNRPYSIMTYSSINKIMSGYHAFQLFDKYIIENYGNCAEIHSQLACMIFPRWILGVLHSTAKYMNYSNYSILINKMNNKCRIYQLIKFPDIRIKAMIYIYRLNKRILWMICRYI